MEIANSPALDNGNIGDFLGIDDLLAFSNEDIGGPIEEACHIFCSNAVVSETVSSNSSLHGKNIQTPNILVDGNESTDFGVPVSLSVSPLPSCVQRRDELYSSEIHSFFIGFMHQCDDLAELDWLSNFVESSFCSGDASTITFSPNVSPNYGEPVSHQVANQQFQSARPVSALDSSACSSKQGSFNPKMAVPGRARSKRSRSRLSAWNTRILSTSARQPQKLGTLAREQETGCSFLPKKVKDTHIKKWVDVVQGRRCLHCASQRTPQWRAGPLGPKTLCNACGVRYKSGRLLPEYRPAASPTFVDSIHSNSHRKVMEMRRQRNQCQKEEDSVKDGQLGFASNERFSSHCFSNIASEM